MLKKKNRLVSEKDYTLIYKTGMKFQGDFGVMRALQVDGVDDAPRFGYVVGKKIGNAVIRHRHTRRLREITREYIKDNPETLIGAKITYISHKYTNDFQTLRNEFLKQLDDVEKFLNKKLSS